jgi:hypothetical protein
MVEAEKVSELHQDIRNRLMSEDFEKVKTWQKDSYHKQMMGGFKESKETDEGFKKAQKPWAKRLKEVSAWFGVLYWFCPSIVLGQEAEGGEDRRACFWFLHWFCPSRVL